MTSIFDPAPSTLPTFQPVHPALHRVTRSTSRNDHKDTPAQTHKWEEVHSPPDGQTLTTITSLAAYDWASAIDPPEPLHDNQLVLVLPHERVLFRTTDEHPILRRYKIPPHHLTTAFLLHTDLPIDKQAIWERSDPAYIRGLPNNRPSLALALAPGTRVTFRNAATLAGSDGYIMHHSIQRLVRVRRFSCGEPLDHLAADFIHQLLAPLAENNCSAVETKHVVRHIFSGITTASVGDRITFRTKSTAVLRGTVYDTHADRGNLMLRVKLDVDGSFYDVAADQAWRTFCKGDVVRVATGFYAERTGIITELLKTPQAYSDDEICFAADNIAGIQLELTNDTAPYIPNGIKIQMFALRFASLFLLASTSIVSATPVAAPAAAAVEKRQAADIQGVLTTLQGTVNDILPQIDSLVSSGTVTDDAAAPLVSSLTAAFDTATESLGSLDASRKRQSNDEIAQLVAEILTNVATSLDGLLNAGATLPIVGSLLPGLDASLNQLLRGLETLLAGLLNLVAQLLVDVAGLLRALALGLTLAALGL
ncbi:Sc15 protein [Mycena kentingensis (nom. inval.)]|nr:Sc15 protein [Mycena kentingensis (nom. inval.)]